MRHRRIAQQFAREEVRKLFHTDVAKVAGGVGDRCLGLDPLVRIVKAVVQELKDLGADPFIIPAMGSHGEATVDGQIEILARYGMTQEVVGAPTFETLDENTPVRLANKVDAVVVIKTKTPGIMNMTNIPIQKGALKYWKETGALKWENRWKYLARCDDYQIFGKSQISNSRLKK